MKHGSILVLKGSMVTFYTLFENSWKFKIQHDTPYTQSSDILEQLKKI